MRWVLLWLAGWTLFGGLAVFALEVGAEAVSRHFFSCATGFVVRVAACDYDCVYVYICVCQFSLFVFPAVFSLEAHIQSLTLDAV